MLIVDGNTHEVFEVSQDCVWTSTRYVRVHMCFSEFERLAFGTVDEFARTLMPKIMAHRHAIVAVRLKGAGFAWGAHIMVHHNGQLPILTPSFGGELLILWPATASIQAFYELHEARRREEMITGTVQPSDNTFPPKPELSVMPREGMLGQHDLPVVRKLSTGELTVPQRLFVAGLPSGSAPFQTRRPGDRWALSMERRDEEEFRQLHAASEAPADQPQPQPQHRQWWRCEEEDRGPAEVQQRGRADFDLPDEMVMHIVSMRLREEMATAASVQAALTTLMGVSMQVRRAACLVIADMQARLRGACESLLIEVPPLSVAQVRRLLQASGLSLAAALRLGGPWYEYVRARSRCEAHGGGPRMLAVGPTATDIGTLFGDGDCISLCLRLQKV